MSGDELDLLAKLGFGAGLSYFVIKELFSLLKKKNQEPKVSSEDALKNLQRDFQDWYVRKDIEKAIILLSENASHQTKLMERMLEEQRTLRKEFSEVVFTITAKN